MLSTQMKYFLNLVIPVLYAFSITANGIQYISKIKTFISCKLNLNLEKTNFKTQKARTNKNMSHLSIKIQF